MTDPKNALERWGQRIMVAGGAAFASLFAVVLLNGAWPEFLRSVQQVFQLINDAVGDLAFVVELAIFLGPGFLLSQIGRVVDRRSSANDARGR